MKQGKRWIALMLALAMCLSVLPANVLATELGSEAETAEVAAPEGTGEVTETEEPQVAETEEPDEEPMEDGSPSTMAATSGKCGKNAKWSYNSKTKTLTISGKGAMYNYSWDKDPPWADNNQIVEQTRHIVVKEGITRIGNMAFECIGEKGMTRKEGISRSISLPKSLTSIGAYAFASYQFVNTITIPKNVKSIGGRAFSSTGVKKFQVDSENKYFTARQGVLFNKDKTILVAYPVCNGMKSYTIPSTVEHISGGAFDCGSGAASLIDGCKLRKIVIPYSVETVDEYVFVGIDGEIYFEGNPPKGLSEAFDFAGVTIYYPKEYESNWQSAKKALQEVEDDGDSAFEWKTWTPKRTGKVVSLSYSSGSKKATNGIATHKYYFDDAFFYKSNETYQNALAVMSLGLELTAFSHPKYDSQYTEQLGNNERAENLKNAYEKLGFSNARYYNYNTPLSDCSDKVAFSFATKEITNETNTDTLVAVVLRGGGYGAEWGSNFYVGDAGNSTGFYFAARRVLQDLRSYLATADVKGELKLWITGYSRAAATANILAHYINGDVQRDGVLDGSGKAVLFKNVYAYTFATPNGYRTANADNVCDNNIMNIVSDNDLVVRVPLEQWGFYKYGRTYILNTKLNRYVEKRFGDLTGQELTCYNAKYELESFLDLIHEAIPSTKEYVDDVQTTLVSALAEMYSTNTSKKQNSENSIQAVAKALLKGNGNTVKTLYKVLVDFVALLAVDRQSKEAHLDIGVAHWPEHYLAWLESGGCKTGSEKEYVRCGEQERALIEASVTENCTYRSAPGVINNPGISTKIVAKDIVKEYSAKNQIFSLGAKASSNGLLHYASNNDSVQVNKYGSVVVKGKFIGKATITITVDETDIYKKATKTITVTVKKASQPIKVSPAKKSYKASALKKKAKKFNIKVKKAKGKVTYTSNSKSVTVNGKGKVTVSKGIKKGTYKVTVTAAETSTYAKATQTVVIRIT